MQGGPSQALSSQDHVDRVISSMHVHTVHMSERGAVSPGMLHRPPSSGSIDPTSVTEHPTSTPALKKNPTKCRIAELRVLAGPSPRRLVI
jgi:hypothetical protein